MPEGDLLHLFVTDFTIYPKKDTFNPTKQQWRLGFEWLGWGWG